MSLHASSTSHLYGKGLTSKDRNLLALRQDTNLLNRLAREVVRLDELHVGDSGTAARSFTVGGELQGVDLDRAGCRAHV